MSPPITGLILAGGKGRRMGGADKGLLEWGGRPIIEWIIEALRPQVASLIINANRNRARYAEYGYPVVGDTLPDHQGPLAGFAAVLAAAATEWVVTVPCDGPRLPTDLVARLWEGRGQAEIAVAHDGERLQPVYALLPRRLLPDLEAFLAAGERKIDRWYARHPMATVDFSDCTRHFANLNTPHDRRQLGKAGP